MRLESAIWRYPEQAPCLADQGLLIRCDACLRFLSSHPEFPSRGVSLSRGYLVVLCSIRGLGYQHFSYNFPPSAGFERQLLLDLSALCLKDGRCDLSSSFSMQNIFLTQDGKVKLGDFGSARLLLSPMAFACTYVGTPYYVPPEIWENMPYNYKSDIWSLGCILYELCTLKHPFQANRWKSLILKICQRSVSPLPSHYSYELQLLIKQMFKKNPSHRPSATTLFSRGSLARLIQKCLPPEIITEYGEQVSEETKKSIHSTPRKKDPSRTRITLGNEASTVQREEPGGKCSHTDLESINKNLVESALRIVNREEKASLPGPLRRQWEKNVPSTALIALENASILTSGLTAEDDRGGSVIKYSESNTRKQWLKETPETLLNILKNADLSLAFQTYTIYRPGDSCLLHNCGNPLI